MASSTTIEICPVDADLALRDWTYYRRGPSRNFKLDYSVAQTSGELQIEEAQSIWRARVVDEAIGFFADTPWLRALLTDLLAHVESDQKACWSFNRNPSGSRAPEQAEMQIKAIRAKVEDLMRAAKGYPKQAIFEAA